MMSIIGYVTFRVARCVIFQKTRQENRKFLHIAIRSNRRETTEVCTESPGTAKTFRIMSYEPEVSHDANVVPGQSCTLF